MKRILCFDRTQATGRGAVSSKGHRALGCNCSKRHSCSETTSRRLEDPRFRSLWLRLSLSRGRLMIRQITFAVLAAGALAACAQERGITAPPALSADLRAHKFSCPSDGTPPSGSRVLGGLEVDGRPCILDGVTVDGGITVDSGAQLQFMSSTVNAGILVLRCGEIDVNATTNGSGVPTGTTSTINGGIVINARAVPSSLASLMPTSGPHRSTAGSQSPGPTPPPASHSSAVTRLLVT